MSEKLSISPEGGENVKALSILFARFTERVDFNAAAVRAGRSVKPMRLTHGEIKWLHTFLADVLQECLVHGSTAPKEAAVERALGINEFAHAEPICNGKTHQRQPKEIYDGGLGRMVCEA